MADRKSRYALALAAALAAGAVSAAEPPAPPPPFNAIDPDTLKDIIAKLGQGQITVDLSDPQGPIVNVRLASGLAYAVFMDDCDGGKPDLCLSLEFRSSLPPGALTFAQINGFNQKMRYATAYLTDKGVPQLRMDENLRGGVTSAFVAYSVQIFTKIVAGYVQETK